MSRVVDCQLQISLIGGCVGWIIYIWWEREDDDVNLTRAMVIWTLGSQDLFLANTDFQHMPCHCTLSPFKAAPSHPQHYRFDVLDRKATPSGCEGWRNPSQSWSWQLVITFIQSSVITCRSKDLMYSLFVQTAFARWSFEASICRKGNRK